MAVGSAILLALGAGGFAAWAFVYSGDSEASYASAKAGLTQAQEARDVAQADYDERVKAERQAANVRAREEQLREEARISQAARDSNWAESGYENVGNNVYFRWLDSGEYSCGNWDCAGFSVVASDGCPSGLYLEAAIMSGGTQVGWTNESFSGLAWGASAAGMFEMVSASGDSFSLTEVNCY